MSRRKSFAKETLLSRGGASGVLITGASGGIGASIALQCAGPGVTLFLWGRDATRLEACAEGCRARGAEARIRTLDLSDSQAALDALREDEQSMPIGFMVLGAGMPDIRAPEALTEDPGTVLTMAQVNFTTPVTLATAAANAMARRKGGAIVAIGSVAAFHDLPQATAYAGTKAGLTRFMTALHGAMRPHGVIVTVVSPGYIDTAMSRRLEGARPFLMTPESAARSILRAVRRGRAHVMFPAPFIALRFLEALVPRRIAHALLRRSEVQQREVRGQ
ncbi:SDR family NAD(P)-dependent oxidoreductase [Brytella acorum]|uniref:SDR family NAD(P)-dependent oxidoreductase n=1 Tax=Brytella acorum TaxID=2959299 RepID=A0AA35XVH5_9PROT|nr:SDR family NAD(P)-dependent oxidoreductase [Brytella acorum]MDF3624404.1 SDR family NAD(P)-dependent oxidoreductase [Brytella acorum]CAI9119746.1 SDR family NAD(P)-dependent oxidoreductase [Brytella acorum]